MCGGFGGRGRERDSMDSCITYLEERVDLPEKFPDPFTHPHPSTGRACEMLQKKIGEELEPWFDFFSPGNGRMFGVLLVRDGEGRVGFLSGFTGRIGGKREIPGFVPPLFDPPRWETEGALDSIEFIQSSQEWGNLQKERDRLLQQRDQALADLGKLQETKKASRYKRGATVPDPVAKKRARRSHGEQEERRKLKDSIRRWEREIGSLDLKIEEFQSRRIGPESQVAILSKVFGDSLNPSDPLINTRGERIPFAELYPDHSPPEGSGDCAGPRLLQYANRNGLKPLALAEFWWGASPAGEVRRSGQTCPSCQDKCGPLLPAMLQGLPVDWSDAPGDFPADYPLEILFEDEFLLAIHKPAGLLSVPGRVRSDSARERIGKLYPDCPEIQPVHRLDLATSGILMFAKTLKIYKIMQKEFLEHKIQKRYVAILSGALPSSPARGRIDLPLRYNPEDKPRQMVCHERGKPATTLWEIVSIDRERNRTRIYFFPLTGRSHQLRVHAAHRDGVGIPILGDPLYGTPEGRLYLHAESLTFQHPVSGDWQTIQCPAPF